MIENITLEFELLDNWTPQSLSSEQNKTSLLQWNLDKSLSIIKFKYRGTLDLSDVGNLIQTILEAPQVKRVLEITGSTTIPPRNNAFECSTNVLSMDFFDVLFNEGIVTPSGAIRGCPDEVYDGINIGDMLRELLVNPESEKAYVFNKNAQKETIFQIFKILCVGGSMCQPDTQLERYIDLTKQLYKELLTVYKDDAGEVKVVTKVYKVVEMDGLQIFKHPENPNNYLLVFIDRVKKQISFLKSEYLPFW